jgi:nitrous oxidase accessory protein NosD
MFSTAKLAAISAAICFSWIPIPSAAKGALPFFDCGVRGVNLQKMIDLAPPGATLRIKGNCATGPYAISKTMNLVGVDSGATLSAPSGSPWAVLTVRGKVQVELASMTIDATGNNSGLDIQKTANVSVSELVISHGKYGIVVDFNSHADIESSDINHNGSGISIERNSSAIITASKIENNANNVVLEFNSSAVLTNNAIRAGNVGVHVARFSSVILAGNTITENAQGILIFPQYGFVGTISPPNTIQNNTTDVQCEDKGIFDASVPSNSTTHRAAIAAGCAVVGSIF